MENKNEKGSAERSQLPGQEPLYKYLGDGRFLFRSQKKYCYLKKLNALGWTWVMDRADGKGIAMCNASTLEKIAGTLAILGLLPAPLYSAEQAQAANDAMAGSGALVAERNPGGPQLSWAGAGAMTLSGAAELALTAGIRSAVAELASALAGGVVLTSIFYSPPVGEGSDRVPGRDYDAMLSMSGHNFSESGIQFEEGATSVELPVRAALSYEEGQLSLKLIKTGEGIPGTVPVLTPVRDEATGLDIITLPAVGATPPRTILINPVPAPSGTTHTGNTGPLPVTPVHTGSEIKVLKPVVILPSPWPYPQRWFDFVYWRLDAKGTGIEPVYVVISNIYGETDTVGKYSGREYNSKKCGGPILDLDWRSARIDRKGVDKVKLHTGRFAESDANKVMIARLEKILQGELQPTDTDKRFYTHEIRELERYRNLGIKDGTVPKNFQEQKAIWNNTHSATLEDYKIDERNKPLYSSDAIKAAEEQAKREEL
ncbi:S-type pyocin domain-containing protein [Jejubacter calystegiae]|nr:S-type pyocin domain-containing protein [Jejubacter calystegiae]